MAEGGGYRPRGRGRGNWHRGQRSHGDDSRPTHHTNRGRWSGRRERGENEFWRQDVRDIEHEGQGRSAGHQRRRGGPPAGLRGREIGMYFAARSKAKKQREDIQGRQVIEMDSRKEREISNLISNIRANDNIQPQPSTSYRDPRCLSDSSDRSHSRERCHHDNDASGSVESLPDCWDDDSFESSQEVTDGMDAEGQGDLPTSVDDGGSQEDATDFEDDALPIWRSENQESEFMAEFRRHTEANRFDFKVSGEVKNCQLKRKPDLDAKLNEESLEKKNNPAYQNLMSFRQKLPSYKMKDEIVEAVECNQVVVLSGETGCGKTTQVAQFILDKHIEDGNASQCHLICTQPRRISAITVAERVAEERGERCGEGNSVGYQIRLEARLPRDQGSILFCTTGILLKRLVSDPWLHCASHVILDEIHERDLQSDFLMIVLKDLLTQRNDLKLILMSATLNADMFARYFGNCPMLNIPGYTFPVKEYLLEDVISMTRYRHNDPPIYKPRSAFRRGRQRNEREERENFEVHLRNLHGSYDQRTINVLRGMDFKEIDYDLVCLLIEHICRTKEEGAILIFLPGWEQISKVHKQLENSPFFRTGSFRLIPLHSMMPTVNQREVFQRPPPGTRKIIIATNIAETSITIDDVVYVIDCGKIKMKNYDSENNITTLQPEWVSLANAKQRRGRAGRVQPGECYHLYTGYHHNTFENYQKPEMLRTRLEELCLQIKLLKLGKILPFVSKAMQPPSIDALNASVRLLQVLNALDEEEELTPLGYHLAKLPVDPHTGKMLLFGAMFSCFSPILTIAAALSFKDAFYIPLGKEKEADRQRQQLAGSSQSDHIMLHNAYKGWVKAKKRGQSSQYCYQNFLSSNVLQMLKNMRQQFVDLLRETGFVDSSDCEAAVVNKYSSNEDVVKAVVCAGLYPNVAKIPGDLETLNTRGKSFRPLKLVTATERKVELHPKSVNCPQRNFSSAWFVYHLKMKTAKIYLYDTSVVSPYPLLFFGGSISTGKMDGLDCVAVDEWIKFQASPNIAKLVKELRIEFDRVLEDKITNPGMTIWDRSSKEGAVMQAIIDLITTSVSSPKAKSHHKKHTQHRNTPDFIPL